MAEALNYLFISAVSLGTIYLFATLGEIITQRSGVMNLGLEGMVMLGAVVSAVTAIYTGSLFLSTLAAMAASALLAALHAFVSIKLKASQVASGLAITILGVGIANYIGKINFSGSKFAEGTFHLTGCQLPCSYDKLPIPLLSDIPAIGQVLFNQNLLVYIGYIMVIVLTIFMFKTKAGMRLRAVGENPAAADAAGINVFGIRYFYTILGGAFSGLAGAYLVLAQQKSFTLNISGGAGWLAVALVIFALWRPSLAFVGSMLFGTVMALNLRRNQLGMQDIPQQFVEMIPYIATIVVLVLISKVIKRWAGGPEALGLPYSREER